MRAKVLFVINSLAGGGAERVMATLLRASRERARDFEFSVALLDDEPAAYALPDWLTVHQLDSRGSLIQSFRQLNGLIGRYRPDVTLSFLTRANVAAIAAMRLRGRPCIISERVNTKAHLATGKSAGLSLGLVRLLYPWASRIIAVSQGVADTLVDDFGVDSGNVSVVANPVDLSSISSKAAQPASIPVEGPYVAAMGRLVPNKNFALAIEAFARSSSEGKLVILGEGREREALEGLALKLGIDTRVLLPGFCDNPYAFLARARYMILSSNAEGFPNALVEALASGVPVIATDCPSGPYEVLEAPEHPKSGCYVEGRGGLLVPPNDAEAMALAIRALADGALRARLTIGGAKRVHDFGVPRAVDRYWNEIEAVLGGRK